MSRDFKPGDVARIELGNGVIHDVALRLPLHEGGWATGRSKYVHSVHVVNARPLVVIDPEDREQVGRVLAHYWHSEDPYSEAMYPEYLADLQDALRSLIAPPKPEEPQGLGAVVEDEGGVPWVRCENADREPHWYARNKMRAYADITAVRVLSEGVTA